MSQSAWKRRTAFAWLFRNVLALIATALFFTCTCWAQNYVPLQPDNTLTPADPIGVPPKPSTAGTFEAVGNTSGALSFFLPVLSLPQRGGWTLTLGYFNTSPQWSLRQDTTVSVSNAPPLPATTNMTYTDGFQQYPSIGPLQLNLPTLQASIEYTGDVVEYIPEVKETQEVPVLCVTNWVFNDWRGNKHQFTNRAVCSSNGTPTGNGNAEDLLNVGDSTDGSWLSLDTSSYTSAIYVRTKDGTVYQFPGGINPFASCGTTCYLSGGRASSSASYYSKIFSSMSDSNGNTITYNGSASTLTDTIGRTISLGGSGITYTDSNGRSETIQATETFQQQQNYSLSPALSCQPNVVPTNVNLTIENGTISSVPGTPVTYTIALPGSGSNRTYTLLFDGLDNLTEITYPGGGYTKYVYQFTSGYQRYEGLIKITEPVEEVAQKRECPSGSCSSAQELVTTYAPRLASIGPYNVSMVVTDPMGDVTSVSNQNLNPNYASYHNDGTSDNTVAVHEMSRSISSGTTLLRTIQTAYTPYIKGADVEVPSQVTNTLNDVSPAISAVTNYQYESFSINLCFNGCGSVTTNIDNPTEIDEYDYSGAHLRATAQTWEPSSAFTPPHILDRLQSRTITDPASGVQQTLNYGYNSNGDITSKTVGGTSVTSLTTNYLRDSFGNITQVTDPKSNVTKFGYTDNWKDSACPSLGASAYLTSITDALNHATNFQYYSCTGLKASAADPNGVTTSFTYDALGRSTLTTFPDTGSIAITYVDSVPNSLTVNSLINANTGLTRTQITTLDGYDRKVETQLTSDPDGTDRVDTTYDSVGRVASVSNAYRTTSDSTYGITTYQYDALDRATLVDDPDCSPACSVVTTTYSGNVTTVTDEAGKKRKSQIDALGRLTNVWEDPSGSDYQTNYSYDAFGNLTNVVQNGSRARTFSYNAFSQLTSATNPESNTITYSYDNDGNLLTKIAYAENQTDSTPTSSHGSFSICCTAQVLDQGTIYVTVGTFNTQVNYNNTSTVNSIASALSGALNGSGLVTASVSGSTVNMTSIATGAGANYALSSSSSGQLQPPKFHATPSGSTMTGGSNPPTVTISYSYDALNRVTKKAYTDGTPTVTYLYDGQTVSGCTPTLAISDGIYRRTGMCDGTGNEAWSYDLMGRVLSDQRTTSSVSETTKYVYFPYVDGSIYQLTYPSGRTITYSTGGSGLPLSAVDTANSINYVTNVHYTPAGSVTSLQNGPNLYSTYIYNNRLQPCWMYATTGTALPWSTTLCSGTHTTGNILDLKYNLNAGAGDNGNVAGITNNRNTARTQTFTYDSLNRLYTAETQGTSGTTCFGFQFSPDPWGNLTATSTLSGYGGCTSTTPYAFSVTVNGNNQVSTSGFKYDAAGNMMSDGINSYVWNGEGQVTSTTGAVTYSYDGEGKRVEKSGGTIYWYGMNGDALDETDLSGSMTNSSFSEYVFFGGKRIARRDSSGTVFYYIADHLGSSREMVQSGQTSPCYDADFLPYGQEVDYTNSCGSHYKFTGKERDTETGNDNFGARYVRSNLGRFTSPDPLGGSLIDPQTLNKYSYVRNNPETLADPTGLYTVNCGNGKPKACLSAASDFEKARKRDLKSKNAATRADAAAYGSPTDKNGITVVFGDPGKGKNGNTQVTGLHKNEDGSFSAEATVTIRPGQSATDLATTVGHEGQHVEDADGFAATVTPEGYYDLSKNLFQLQTEINAYRITNAILSDEGLSENFGTCGDGPCILGEGVKDPDATIRQFLANPANGYGLTDANPGFRQFREITVPNPAPAKTVPQ